MVPTVVGAPLFQKHCMPTTFLIRVLGIVAAFVWPFSSVAGTFVSLAAATDANETTLFIVRDGEISPCHSISARRTST